MNGPSPQKPENGGGTAAPLADLLLPRLEQWASPRCELAATKSEIFNRSQLPDPAPAAIVAFSVLPSPPSEAVGFSAGAVPVPSDVVGLSAMPAPPPDDVIRFAVLPAPARSAVVGSRVLPAPAHVEVVRSKVLPAPARSAVVGSRVLPAPAHVEVVRSKVLPAPVRSAVVGSRVLSAPAAAGVVGSKVLPAPGQDEVVRSRMLPAPAPSELVPSTVLPQRSRLAVAPDVALEPPLARSTPPSPKPSTRRAPAPPSPKPPTRRAPTAPSRPHRFRVGLVAVVLGALGVVAVREFVGRGDEEDVDSAVEPPGAATQPVISGDTTPAAGQPAAPETTVATAVAPTVSAVSPIDPATEAPATPTSLVATPPTSLVATPPANSVPAAGVTQFSGYGNFVIDVKGYDLSRKVMVVTHNGVANFELSTLDQDLNQLALVESVVGPLSGTYPLGFEGDGTPSYLRIDADGDWTIDIKPVEEARLWQADFISGTGPDVLRYEGGASVLDYTNAGSSNFIVQYHRNPGFDLLINEIGPISGATTMQAGPGVVVVDAEGDWALNARPS